jgi:hypothetical protein
MKLLPLLVLFSLGAGAQEKKGQGLPPQQYAQEIKRTKPDIVVYKPKGEFLQGENQHFLVVTTPKKRLLAFWTQSTRENHPDQKVVVSRSDDQGKTWTEPASIDGAGPNDPAGTGLASWGFPIVAPKTGRVWFFYNKNIGIQDTREDTTGVLRGRFSQDEGVTWSEPFDIPIPPCALSHPDPKVPQSWIVYQSPILAGDGVPIVGFTHWGSAAVFKTKNLFQMDSEIRFFRFENILEELDPAKLQVTTWPKSDQGLRVPFKQNPKVSVVQEPSLVLLPDGRLFCTLRTLNGYVAWSQSRDNGKTWSAPAPLRNRDGKKLMKNPIAPCPIYALGEGRFVLLFYNNDGTANGGKGPTDYQKNRNPLFLAVGTFQPNAEQPIWFEHVIEWMSSDGVILGPSRRTEVATYTSFGKLGDRFILWYPDRKHFLLGRFFPKDLPGFRKD